MGIENLQQYTCDVCGKTVTHRPDNFGGQKPSWFKVSRGSFAWLACKSECLYKLAESIKGSTADGKPG